MASTSNQNSRSDSDTVQCPVDLNAWLPHIPIGHPDSMMSKESVRQATEDFVTRPSDIIVTTFAKTGTTLVTFLAHLLRTRADETALDFDCMYDVVPWPLLSWDIGVDANTATPTHLEQPRIFKSHLRLSSIYRGAKYVVTIREPSHVGKSFHRFLQAKKVPSVMAMDVDTFICETYFVKGHAGRPSLWDYYAEYHAVLNCPAVLILVYEDLAHRNDTKRICVQQLAQFMGLPPDDICDDALIDRILAMSTKQAMAVINDKFDEPYDRACQLGRAADLSQLAPGPKVALRNENGNSTKSKSTTEDLLLPRTHAFLQDQWDQQLAPLGYADYASLAATVRCVNHQRFGTSRADDANTSTGTA